MFCDDNCIWLQYCFLTLLTRILGQKILVNSICIGENHLSKNSTDSSVCLWTLFAQFLLFHSLCFLIMGYVEVSKNKSYDCVRKLQTFCINCISGSNSNIIQLCYPKQHQNCSPLSFWNPKYKCIYYCQHCTSLLEIQTKEFLWKEMKWSRTRGV